ncbi:Ppx/GppA phosphatase family protein [Caulobacter sp. UNC279MFTsu5.1]|uniref:Ppx/GppA phosphatase family protein n=1 Tax=Caulobacter sp. UNC279MFTsu5.1 TaxID=1502775 RepID=UPI00036EE04F|nr:Ppx/GppA phosphatase family protein [Caulobacter sp. UNC279MFTsu5.1]SFJ62541.1 exopolyphosphatase / guanosine-5'-triphosphate,3'-diphosphate pyrophosphatase [Caulobacter sp. UNC279MFTsu5.1]
MPFAAPRDAAVIDIGSNSVRLVVYRLEGRAIWTVFNEKVLAGLGRDLGDGGRLNPEGVAQTLAALKRFRAVLEAVKPAETFIAATAAVREAKDGAAFVARIKAETGFSTRVLSGEEEARYAAVGVLAGTPDATGVVGDLGGASLELIRLESTGAGLGVTLPLGPFSLGLSDGFDLEKVRRLCAQRLAPAAQAFKADVFHAVGGAWRNLALLHMRLSDYPLHVVHQYSISRNEALEAARLVAHQSKSSLDRIEGMSRKRSETLPYAAVVLEQLIESLDLKRIEISAYGVREGLLFEAMPPGVRRLDPLIEGCASLGARQGVADELGAALDAWLAPALAQLPPCFGERDPVLASAACRLADLGARLHPDHRADLVFEQVLRAPIAGQTHAERAFLAAAAFARHATAFTPPEMEVLERLLSPGRLKRARAVGAAIRLGCDLSGRSAPLLARSRLAIDKGDLLLAAEPGYADLLLGEQTAKRAGALAALLGLKLKITAL